MQHAPPSAPDTPTASSTPVQASPAQISQIAADLAPLRTQLHGMQQDHSALLATMARAKRMHWVALAFSACITAAAWVLNLSEWLRFYLLPVTVSLVLLFAIGSRMLARWMAGKVEALQHFVDDASQQLAQVQPLPPGGDTEQACNVAP